MASPLSGRRVVVTGGAGFLGREVVSQLAARGVADLFIPRRKDYDLTTGEACRDLFRDAFGGTGVDVVVHLAAEVGGIGANQANPGRYFYANMAMALHLIEAARLDGLPERGGKFVQVGTVCSYPKFAPIPFHEDDIWSGYPEETNAPYGVAKRAAWQMLDAYRRQYGMASAYVVPVNLYGPHDNFDPESSHVIPALIRKCAAAVDAGEDTIVGWGTGRATREFLYVADAAGGIIAAAELLEDPIPVNLGTGTEVSIAEVLAIVSEAVGFGGTVEWDTSRPDGQPRRSLDTTRAQELLDWRATTELREGIARTVAWWRSEARGQ